MYSVVRFLASSTSREVLRDLSSQLLGVVPAAEWEENPKEPVLTGSLSWAASWWEQRDAILEFAEVAEDVLADAKRLDVSVLVDLAIWPQDMVGIAAKCIEVDPELMAVLSKQGVRLEFTIYVLGAFDDDDLDEDDDLDCDDFEGGASDRE